MLLLLVVHESEEVLMKHGTWSHLGYKDRQYTTIAVRSEIAWLGPRKRPPREHLRKSFALKMSKELTPERNDGREGVKSAPLKNHDRVGYPTSWRHQSQQRKVSEYTDIRLIGYPLQEKQGGEGEEEWELLRMHLHTNTTRRRKCSLSQSSPTPSYSLNLINNSSA